MENDPSTKHEDSEHVRSGDQIDKPQPSQPLDFPLYRPPADFLGVCGALSIFGALLILLPSIPTLSSQLLGGFSGDGGLYVWLTRQFSAVRPGWFDTLAFYPYGKTLAWSDNYLFPAAITSFFEWCGVDLVLAYNITLASSLALLGFCTGALSYSLSGRSAESLLSAFAALTFSPLLAQIGHPQLLWMFFIPLGLMCLFSYLSSRQPAWGAVFGLVVVGCFLSCVYYAIFLCLIAALLIGAMWLIRPKRQSVRSDILFVLSGCGIGLCALPFFLPYLSVRSVFGGREIYEAYAFAANGAAYLAASPWSLLYSPLSSLGHDEAFLFIGIIPLAFLVLAYQRLTATQLLRKTSCLFLGFFFVSAVFSDRNILKPLFSDDRLASTLANSITTIAAWGTLLTSLYLIRKIATLEEQLNVSIITNRAILSLLFFLSVSFYLLSLGPLGNPERGQFALGPWRIAYLLLPGFESIRAVSRMGLLAGYFACVLPPFVLPLIIEKFPGRFSSPHRICALLGVFLLLESWQTRLPLEAPAARPQVFQALDAVAEDGGAVIALPFAPSLTPELQIDRWSSFAAAQVSYMNWTLDSGLPAVNGYSGQRTSLMRTFPRDLYRFPDQRALQALGTIAGLRYIVYHAPFDPAFDAKQFQTTLALASSQLALLSAVDGSALFRFSPGPTLLTDRYSLRCPPYPSGELELEIKSLYVVDTPLQILRVREVDQLDGALIASLPIPADGEWHSFTIPLPLANERARPFRLEFDPESTGTFYLGRRDFRQR